MKQLIFLAAFFFLLNQINAQTVATDNSLFEIPTGKAIPTGSKVLGVFEGRPPCQEIAKQLKFSMDPGCYKMKWRLILYRDPETGKPATFQLWGSFNHERPREGNWQIIRGMQSNADAIIYKLDMIEAKQPLYLYKGDDNVLFILDEQKNFRVGNESFSYTLNRVKLVPMKSN